MLIQGGTSATNIALGVGAGLAAYKGGKYALQKVKDYAAKKKKEGKPLIAPGKGKAIAATVAGGPIGYAAYKKYSQKKK